MPEPLCMTEPAAWAFGMEVRRMQHRNATHARALVEPSRCTQTPLQACAGLVHAPHRTALHAAASPSQTHRILRRILRTMRSMHRRHCVPAGSTDRRRCWQVASSAQRASLVSEAGSRVAGATHPALCGGARASPVARSDTSLFFLLLPTWRSPCPEASLAYRLLLTEDSIGALHAHAPAMTVQDSSPLLLCSAVSEPPFLASNFWSTFFFSERS